MSDFDDMSPSMAVRFQSRETVPRIDDSKFTERDRQHVTSIWHLLHSLNRSVTFLNKKAGVVPHDLLGNPRAKKLAQRDVLAEFRWLKNASMTLALYGMQIQLIWRGERKTLPDRPRLPNRGQKKSRLSRNHQPQQK